MLTFHVSLEERLFRHLKAFQLVERFSIGRMADSSLCSASGEWILIQTRQFDGLQLLLLLLLSDKLHFGSFFCDLLRPL